MHLKVPKMTKRDLFGEGFGEGISVSLSSSFIDSHSGAPGVLGSIPASPVDDLIRPMLLSSRHSRLFSCQFLAHQPVQKAPGIPRSSWVRSWTIAIVSFLFILLQSACTAVIALSGLRLLIGIGSLAAISGIKIFAGTFHTDAIRIPMMIVATGGSAINLYVIWRIRSLRRRPASQWRVGTPAKKQLRAESIQIALALLTLLMVAVEWFAHIHLHGSI